MKRKQVVETESDNTTNFCLPYKGGISDLGI